MPAEPASILAHQLRRLTATDSGDSQELAARIYNLLEMERQFRLAAADRAAKPVSPARLHRRHVRMVRG